MKVHIKVWTTNLNEFETFVFPCHASTKDELIQRFVAEIQRQFPGNELRIVHIGKDRVNVIPQPVANA